MTEPLYAEALRARLRFLNDKLDKTERWDISRSALSKEREDVECELALLWDKQTRNGQ
jgi:hypothetical protein